MGVAAIPDDEADRLASLYSLGILDTTPEERFDRLTGLARRVFNLPISVITLIDRDRQWFKSCLGLAGTETSRDISFCAHAILQDDPTIVPDTRLDARFADNPQVLEDPYLRFYAGQPLHGPGGYRLGTLCVVGQEPHTFTADDVKALKDLAKLAETELNNVELGEALRQRAESEERIRTLMDSVPDGIVVFNAAGTVESANPAAHQIFGAPGGDLVGQSIASLMEDPDLRQQLHARLSQGPLDASVATRGSRELLARRADDLPVPVELSVSALGDPVSRFIAVVRDVSQRKQAEVARARLAALVESSQDAILATTLDGIITSWNAAAEWLYGHSATDAIGQSLALIVPPDRVEEQEHALAKVRAGQRSAEFETVRVRADGSLVDVSVSTSPILDNLGQVVGVSVIARDLTERMRAEQETRQALEAQQEANEQLRRLNQAKSDFVSMVSHEFRTPLTVIQGFSEMLRDEELPVEEIQEFAENIHRDSVRLGRLINDMLDLNRMESGRMVLRMQTVALPAVARSVVELFRLSAANHPIHLEVDPRVTDVPGDPDRLTQVFTNLVANAVKYSPDGGEIRISMAPEDDCVHVRVHDCGIGVPPDSLEAIFDRYTRIENGAARQVQGTGLGLPIVREIMQLHGGSVWAENGPGPGSTFHVRLPLQPVGTAAA